MRRRWTALVAASITVAFIGCTGLNDSNEAVLVSVASSLTDPFTEIELELEELHPEIDVKLNIAGSTTLVNQIDGGAEVDIVALADETATNSLSVTAIDRSLLTDNWLVVLQRSDKPPFASLTDLVGTDLIISACDPSVPCGRLTQHVLLSEGVPVTIDTFETSVRIVRERVRTGEADVGFVYATDAVDLPSDVMVAPIDLVEYQNSAFATLLTDRQSARIVYDYVIDYYSEHATQFASSP